MTLRRRPAPQPGLFAPPLAMEQTRPAAPIVAGNFEARSTGASMLLRVHVDGAFDRADAALIMGDGQALDVVRPLPGSRDTLGFAVPARALEARFWLDLGGRVLPLGEPTLA